MSRKGYVTIGLPAEIVENCEVYMSRHPEQGYKSVPEYIKAAIREKLAREENKTERPSEERL